MMTHLKAPQRTPMNRLTTAIYLNAAFLSFALAGCSSMATTADSADASSSSLLTVTAATPADGASDVAPNVRIAVAFSTAIDPATVNATSFLVKQGDSALAGTVTVNPDGRTATFASGQSLPATALLSATLTRDAKGVAGETLAADFTWSFTTGADADTTAPSVTATTPGNGAIGATINTKIAVTFSEAMDPLTLNATTWSVKQGTTLITGSLVYGSSGTTAVFTPTATLAINTAFTVTVTSGAMDLAGNPLAAPYSWTFTTGTSNAKGPPSVFLGTAGNFAVLSKSGISSVPGSVIVGDMGVSPAAATYLTGFSLVADASNVFSTSPQVTGKIYAANYAVPTPANLTTAISNLEGAYSDAAGRPGPDFLELGSGAIGGLTLAPGLYKWTSTLTIPTDVTFSGGADDVWILQTTGDLAEAAGQHVVLAGGAQAKNIFWQIAGGATLGANSHFEGILISKTAVTLQTGATMNGRILAQTHIALEQAAVTQPVL